MRNGVKRLSLVAMLVCVAGAVSAKPVIYDCKPASGKSTSVIQPQILISYDAANGEVIVTDPVILSEVGKPVAGKLQSESAVRYVFDWRVDGVLGGRSETAALDYRARVFKDGRLSLTVTPVGYDNQFSSEGHCTIQK